MTRLLKRSIRIGLPVLALLAADLSRAASVDEVVKSFEKDKGYIQPFATLFGSMTNSGWYQSASVARGFSFYLGMPINLVQISDDDRTFKGSIPDNGCIAYHKDNPSGKTSCPESIGYTGQTIFGKGKGPTLSMHNYDLATKTVTPGIDTLTSDGLAGVAAMNWIPFGMPQIGISYYHTELKLRYIALPLQVVSMSMPGFGLQHDFAWAMPNSPVHASLAANWTLLSAEWTPGGDISGKMKLDGSAATYNALAGWTWKNWLEVFTEIGWETASLKSSGSLILNAKKSTAELVKPNLTMEGRNGFRMSLNLAFHLGYDAVLGQNIGADFGNQVSVLAYRYK